MWEGCRGKSVAFPKRALTLKKKLKRMFWWNASMADDSESLGEKTDFERAGWWRGSLPKVQCILGHYAIALKSARGVLRLVFGEDN